jgi:DNA-binding transcriptional ArsR family regulator
MPTNASLIAEIAHLVGDPARANILSALMGGEALTALDLAAAARVTPQTTSSHLAKLLSGELLTVERRGRHRYYQLATPLVAQMLEGIMTVAACGPQRRRPPSRLDSEMRHARMCYDHLAGRLGVAILDALVERDHVLLGHDAGEVTESGYEFFKNINIELSRDQPSRRVFCRPCLDWSERRPHIAGRIGAVFAQHCFEQDWIRRRLHSRALDITTSGKMAFSELFGIRLEQDDFADGT